MSLPRIIPTIAGYKFHWNDEQIAIDVSRLHSHSDGRVTGEIIVTSTLPGIPPHLHQASHNFTSSSSRDRLAGLLNKRCELNWADILEQLTVYTLERVRRGEPVEELYSGEGIHPPRYVAEPLIIENYPNIIFGDPGALKSNFAIVLSQIVQLPWYDNPLGIVAPEQSVRVLFLDWETDKATVTWLVTTLERGMDLGSVSVKYRQCSLTLAQDIEQLKTCIDEAEAELIIIDSLGLAAGGELKGTESALSFFSALRQLKCTSLILAHNSKDPETKNKSIYGNQFFTAQSRNIWEIRKVQEPGSNEADIALFHRKPAPFTNIHKPLGFKVIFNDDAGTMQVQTRDPRNVGEFLERMGNQTRIIELLKDNPLNPKEIAESLNLDYHQTIVTLARLQKQSKITKSNEGKYGLLFQESLGQQP